MNKLLKQMMQLRELGFETITIDEIINRIRAIQRSRKKA